MTLTQYMILVVGLLELAILIVQFSSKCEIEKMSIDNDYKRDTLYGKVSILAKEFANFNSIDSKIDSLDSKVDKIANKDSEIQLREGFTYKGEKYVVDGITTSMKSDEVEEINVHLVKGKSVLIRW